MTVSQPWLDRIARVLHLAPQGLLAVARGGPLTQLRGLLATLHQADADVRVCLDARELVKLPPNSLALLLLREEDISWLNVNRPIFATKSLRVIVWASDAVLAKLLGGAPDFSDWISHVVDVPPRVADFAVASFRRAADNHPWVFFSGTDLETCFSRALPNRRLVRCDSGGGYEALVDQIERNRRSWLAFEIQGSFELIGLRWALAQARRRSRVVLQDPGVFLGSHGWWEVTSRPSSIRDLASAYRERGVPDATRVAIALDLEWCGELIEGWNERGLGALPPVGELLKQPDPGRWLAAKVPLSEGDIRSVADGRYSGPRRRAHCDNGLVRAHTHRLRRRVGRQLKHGEPIGELAFRLWSVGRRRPRLSEGWQRMAREESYLVEPTVEVAARLDDARLWGELASVANYWGLPSVSASWSARAERLQAQPELRISGAMRRLDLLLEIGAPERARLLLAEIGQDQDIRLLNPEFLLARARVSLADGDDTAAERYREALHAFVSRDGAAPMVVVSEAAHSLLEGGEDVEAATMVIEHFRRFDGHLVPAALGELVTLMAQRLVESGTLQVAEELLQDARRFAWPVQISVGMQQALGSIYLVRGNLERAALVLRVGLELTADKPESAARAQLQASLATVRISEGRYDEAEELLKSATLAWETLQGPRKSTDQLQIELLRALVEQARGRYAAAAGRYRRMLDDQPTDPSVRLTAERGLGVCLVRLERLQEALAVFREAAGRLVGGPADYADFFLDYARMLANVAARSPDQLALWRECAHIGRGIWEARARLSPQVALGGWAVLNSALAALDDAPALQQLQAEHRQFLLDQPP